MKNETKNRIYDLILTDALMTSLDIEIKAFDEESEYDNHKFSTGFERKYRKTANSIGRKNKIKICTHICVKTVVTAAAIMGVIFSGLLTQPTVNAAVQNVIRTVFEKYDRYDFVGKKLTIENFNNDIRLGYVPDGYYLSKGDYSHISVSLTYVDNNGNEIMLDYSIADGASSIYDNEHNLYGSFTIDGIEYYYYESLDNDFYDKLVWYKEGYAFSIFAHLPKEELVKIAENIK